MIVLNTLAFDALMKFVSREMGQADDVEVLNALTEALQTPKDQRDGAQIGLVSLYRYFETEGNDEH